MLTLLTVGTHQPYSAPEQYLQRYDTPKQAAVAYLDDAIGAFLDSLERQGVLKDTLVVVTSDESHGIDGVRLASSWGFNLTLAPEQAELPRVKRGTYGHIDLAASLLDYFALPIPDALGGRSLYRNYDSGREMIAYTNGMLRYHNGQEYLPNAISSSAVAATPARASLPTRPSTSALGKLPSASRSAPWPASSISRCCAHRLTCVTSSAGPRRSNCRHAFTMTGRTT